MAEVIAGVRLALVDHGVEAAMLRHQPQMVLGIFVRFGDDFVERLDRIRAHRQTVDLFQRNQKPAEKAVGAVFQKVGAPCLAVVKPRRAFGPVDVAVLEDVAESDPGVVFIVQVVVVRGDEAERTDVGEQIGVAVGHGAYSFRFLRMRAVAVRNSPLGSVVYRRMMRTPCGVSSIMMPFSFSSSRMRSASA